MWLSKSQRYEWLLNPHSINMFSSSRNLLVIFTSTILDEKALEQEADCLHQILLNTKLPEHFCTAHELVDRNRISSNRKKILRASRAFLLKPFRFLINKN